MPKTNVFTIKENSITTSTNTQSTNYIPNTQADQISSPFARSQSFNNYSRYRNNVETDKRNLSNNIEYPYSRTNANIDKNYKVVRNDTSADNGDSIYAWTQEKHIRTPSVSTCHISDNNLAR